MKRVLSSICRRSRSHVVLAMLVVGLVALVWSPLATRPSGKMRNVDEQLQRERFRAGGLRAAAAVSGSVVVEWPEPTIGEPLTLGELADVSHLIVVGSSKGGICRLTPDGRSIVTLHEVHVSRVLKGAEIETVTVAVPGGKVGFPGGDVAEVRTPDFLPPNVDLDVLWFLRHAPDLAGLTTNGNVLVPARGGLGVYDLSPANGRIIPSGKHGSVLAHVLLKKRLNVDGFMAEVAAAIR